MPSQNFIFKSTALLTELLWLTDFEWKSIVLIHPKFLIHSNKKSFHNTTLEKYPYVNCKHPNLSRQPFDNPNMVNLKIPSLIKLKVWQLLQISSLQYLYVEVEILIYRNYAIDSRPQKIVAPQECVATPLMMPHPFLFQNLVALY